MDSSDVLSVSEDPGRETHVAMFVVRVEKPMIIMYDQPPVHQKADR